MTRKAATTMNNACEEPEEDQDGENDTLVKQRRETGDRDATMNLDEESEEAFGGNNAESDEGKSGSGSNSGSGSGSGSGGGYSADCSASDQSSDEGKSNKNTSSSDNSGNAGGSPLSDVPLDQLGINDESQVSAKHDPRITRAKGLGDASGTGAASPKSQKISGKAKSKRGSHSKKEQSKNNKNGGVRDDDSIEIDGPKIGLPLKSPDHIDIDAIVEAKEQQDRENASFFASGQQTQLPQWNGVRVGNPMDPRIDLSSVSILPGGSSFPLSPPFALAAAATAAAVAAAADSFSNTCASAEGSSLKPPPPSAESMSPAQPQQGLGQRREASQNTNKQPNVPSVESYMQLMEMVRPFFTANGVPYSNPTYPQPQPPQQPQGQNDQHQPSSSDNKYSSEGFTSFFTTTHSSQQSGSSSENGPQETSKQQNDKKEGKETEGDCDIEAETNKSDSSSMVVLARVKRKHKKGDEDSGERRVRIQEGGKGDAEDDEEESSGSSADHKPKAKPRAGSAAAKGAGEAPNGDESPGSSTSSSSVTIQDVQRAQAAAADNRHQHEHVGVPPRIVTDVSSAARTDSGPSTSSGSGGNTGSGSNQGTSSGSGSGSGNDKGSSEEGKGSSEEGKGSSEEGGRGGSASEEPAAREDNSGESPEGGSDQSDSKKQRVATKTEHHHHPPHNNVNEPSTGTGGLVDTEAVDNIEAKQKQKLADKKRKRIEMRREYEAQQHLGSTDSSDQKQEQEPLLKPGRPVSMAEVLQFSKIARVVMQASPPFLVVHANAAFTRLTGIDSHKVVGKPIGSILSLPLDGSRAQGRPPHEHSSSASGNPQSSEDSPPRLPPNQDTGRGRIRRESVERLVAASGFGRLHSVHVVARHSQLVGKSVSFPKEQAPPAPSAPSASSARENESQPVAGSEPAVPAGMDRGRHLVPEKGNDPSFSSANTNSRGTNSNAERAPNISCRASIAPIVSAMDLSAANNVYVSNAGVDDENEAKRRKHSPGEHSALSSRKSATTVHEENDSKRRKTQSSMEPPSRKHREQQQRQQIVTHYVVQLEVEQAGDRKFGSVGSLSSHTTSVEGHLVGLSKTKIRQQRAVTSAPNNGSTTAGANDNVGSEEAESESTDTKDHIAAVG